MIARHEDGAAACWPVRFFVTFALLLSSPTRSNAAVNLIVDSDIGPDCGDVHAIILLHGLADRGEVNILAAMCDTANPWGAACLDALNTFYGRPSIPVGTLKDPDLLRGYTDYNRELATHYPHALQSGIDAPNATALYRQILASQPEHSVVIVAIGPLRNLGNLLKSGADTNSPLSGRELVAKKVALLSDMGGWYPSVPQGWGPEWNFAQDPSSTENVVSNWPTPIMFSGAELGGGIYSGHRHATECVEYDPLTMAFTVAPDVGFGGFRMSWDETSCIYGVCGLSNFWRSVPGWNSTAPGGSNVWRPSAAGGQAYLLPLMSNQDVANAIDDISTAAKQGPLTFDFNTSYYSQDGMGAITARGGDPKYPKENAFDRDLRTKWLDSVNRTWIQYQFPDGKKYVVTSYALISASDGAEFDPTGWTLSGSNDGGTNWTTLDTRSGQSFSGRNDTRTYSLANDAPYNIHRFQFTSSGAAVSLGGIELRERINNQAGVSATGIALDQTTVSLPVAGRASLNCAIAPVNALNKSVAWASTDPTVATVKRIGKNTAVISGVGVGTCAVTATTVDGGQTASCAVQVVASTLPHPWTYADINKPAVPGGATYANGEFSIAGGGIDIDQWQYCIADQFGYVAQDRNGNGVITARVVAQSITHRWAKAGVMFRETADKYSRYVLLAVMPDKSLILKWRDVSNPPSGGQISLTYSALPLYLQLERIGNTFNAYTSTDGVNWGNRVATRTVAMDHSLKAGLCVNSRNEPTTSLARFDHVSVRGVVASPKPMAAPARPAAW